ncbi:hypothetical protein HHK36_017536 [Tetracentron sinense]|uniref:Aconitase/3-isopropylmalate dehydratase large subunit alpha/beta/alpha domain-containing protein n=1 Tax=Tetracentron sinense TaxID=13715 RepID=A0A834Z2Y4_TETSI|nr:hypothetical protein HHK36_017536 [Tetracentron sinense]
MALRANPYYKGVCHIALAQEVLLGTDSHTCDVGAFGQFATGIGNTDAGFVLGTGTLILETGIVASLDALVKEFLSASNEEKKAIFSRIAGEADHLKGSTARSKSWYGKIYLTAVKNFMEKGADYAKNEMNWLHSMLNKSIRPAKATEFTLKKNILSTFA